MQISLFFTNNCTQNSYFPHFSYFAPAAYYDYVPNSFSYHHFAMFFITELNLVRKTVDYLIRYFPLRSKKSLCARSYRLQGKSFKQLFCFWPNNRPLSRGLLAYLHCIDIPHTLGYTSIVPLPTLRSAVATRWPVGPVPGNDCLENVKRRPQEVACPPIITTRLNIII